MSTRQRVLEELRDAGADGVSGERLAGELGVSRVAVGKHVATLRRLGYEIEAVPGIGYRLVSSPDRAIPCEVRPHVADGFWVRFTGTPETGSTNDDAKTLAEAGAPEGTAVVAASQRRGRGRFGREWSSPEGGAYVSFVLRPRVAPADAGPLALVVALGIARGLETLGVPARIKWPNDVHAGGRKIAGVLLEMSAEADLIRWVVGGFGLNVAACPESHDGAACVRDFAPDTSVAQAAGACLDGIAEAYGEWLTGGFGALLPEYEARASLTGERVTVSDATGAVRVAGVVTGVDADGHLLVDPGDGPVAVSSGEVTLRT